MKRVDVINPYEASVGAKKSPELSMAAARTVSWIGNTVTFYLIGFVYFALFQCACPAVHLVQFPGLIVPFAWSTYTILTARTLGEGIVAGVNGLLMGGLILLFLIPFVMRFSMF